MQDIELQDECEEEDEEETLLSSSGWTATSLLIGFTAGRFMTLCALADGFCTPTVALAFTFISGVGTAPFAVCGRELLAGVLDAFTSALPRTADWPRT
jgi:hypothetical protein